MKRVVLATGGFDPIHSGHLMYLEEAASLGDVLVVGLNSDQWLRRKKGREFMPWSERAAVLRAVKYVDQVVEFNDDDGTAGDAIRVVSQMFDEPIEVIFVNGGDRTVGNVPEKTAEFEDLVVKFVFGVGGDFKTNSSSWLLSNWQTPFIQKPWGSYRVLFECPGIKVKELTVNPGASLSMQRHQYRTEHWFVAEGLAALSLFKNENEGIVEQYLDVMSTVTIHPYEWHQLRNPYHDVCRIVEVQVGNICVEEDIERL